MDSIRNREIVKGLKGRQCIYKAKVLIYLARVVAADVDDWGVKLKFEIISTLGAHIEGRDRFAADGRWDIIDVSERVIYASYAGWMVQYNKDAVEEIVDFAPKAGGIVELIQYVNMQS